MGNNSNWIKPYITFCRNFYTLNAQYIIRNNRSQNVNVVVVIVRYVIIEVEALIDFIIRLAKL